MASYLPALTHASTMDTPRPRAGRPYTLPELAEIARVALAESGTSQARAAEILNERFAAQRGRFRQPQVSAALNEPDRNPGMVMLLIEAFTPYRVNESPRYILERQ